MLEFKLLLITLTRISRRGVRTCDIHTDVAKVLRDSRIVGKLRDPQDHDSEKLVRVSVELGQKNSVCVVQSAPLNGRWFDLTTNGGRAFKTAIIMAVNDGLTANLSKRAFVFTLDKSGAALVNVPQVVTERTACAK